MAHLKTPTPYLEPIKRRTIMGKTVKSPKKFIVSCRVNDNEMEALSKLAQEAGTNISDLLRQSIFMLEQDLRAHA
jgi:hypothetical protein